MDTEPDDDAPDEALEDALDEAPDGAPDEVVEELNATTGDREPIDIDNPDPISTARRRYGSAGAGLAAAMFGLDQALTGKQKPEFVQVQEASGQPLDVDSDGITVAIDEGTSVQAPALERRPPVGLDKKKPRRR